MELVSIALLLLAAAGASDGGERGRRRAPAPPLPFVEEEGGIVVSFPIVEGQQPADYPPRKYQDLLAATPAAARAGDGAESARARDGGRPARSLDSRETASGRDLRALMREWGQINWLDGPGSPECARIVAGVLEGKTHVAIVTTAALPWLTGTAVNPLLRAAYLAKRGARVTLLLPWLHPSEQRLVFAGNLTFGTPAEQEGYVLAWLADRAGVSAAELGGRLQLRWYGARYHASKGSVLALGDLTQHFGPGESGVCVLEEPEHLNWYHHGERWCGRWQLVIGIIHTNYWSYTRSHETGGLMAAALTQQINRWLCGGYCHKSIKLSDALPPLPRSVTENTHGVRDDFLKLGARVGEALEARRAGAARGEGSLPAPPFSKGMYFIGKALWAKGHRELFQLLGALAAAGAPGASAAAAAGGVGGGLAARRLGGGVGGSLTLPRGGGASTPPEFDVYGSGADKPSIELAAAALAGRVTIRMHGGIDHADSALHAYKIFVNPSRSDVLCTTTAEALAMGKFAIIEDNPSNAFFQKLPNCLLYRTPQEFVAQVQYALGAEPQPLDASQRYLLSWEAATDRLIDAMLTPVPGEEGPNPGDKAFAAFHQSLFRGKFGDWSRAALGAGPIAQQFELSKEQTGAAPPDVVRASFEAPAADEARRQRRLSGKAIARSLLGGGRRVDTVATHAAPPSPNGTPPLAADGQKPAAAGGGDGGGKGR